MPEKKDYYSSYGQKLISLFARLLFTQRSHSLIELARMLNCSKQTVLRLVDDIRRSYGVEIEEFLEGKRKYYRIKRLSKNRPSLNITESELSALYMCKTFAEHLMGKEMFTEASRALEKNQSHLSAEKQVTARHFASFKAGSIDYTPHQDAICALIEAMDNRKICKVTYKSIMASRAKTFYIKPQKIYCHKDSVYLHAHLARAPGKPYRQPEFNPLLAVHRIKKVEITERLFEYPKNYDFDRAFKQNFGVIKEDAFKVEVEFTGWAAKYASERIWSPDQKIVQNNGRTVLTFSASSEPELVSWVLSFGDEATLLKPVWLSEEVLHSINRMQKVYKKKVQGSGFKGQG
ncbi:MAG: WYL domain-containing protein [Desulfobacterales bacterium]|jgi:predicted DNA-binding transcriptional regulator YafY